MAIKKAKLQGIAQGIAHYWHYWEGSFIGKEASNGCMPLSPLVVNWTSSWIGLASGGVLHLDPLRCVLHLDVWFVGRGISGRISGRWISGRWNKAPVDILMTNSTVQYWISACEEPNRTGITFTIIVSLHFLLTFSAYLDSAYASLVLHQKSKWWSGAALLYGIHACIIYSFT